jgi:hypothetical protein
MWSEDDVDENTRASSLFPVPRLVFVVFMLIEHLLPRVIGSFAGATKE